MAKNRNHYFKVKPGDEERMLRGVDVQAIGLLHRLRIVTFDCDPMGFAVDHKRRPLDLEGMADVFGMTNGRFRTTLNELLERQLIQSAAAYRDALLSSHSGWVKLKIDVLHDLLRAFSVPLSDIFVVPTLVDEYVDTLVGQRTQKLRKNGTPDPSMPPMDAPHVSVPPVPGMQAQMSTSEVKGQNQNQSSASDSSRERESSTAHARGDRDERPMPWSAYTARCHDISVWQKRQLPMSEEAFDAAFDAEFGMGPWSLWVEIKRRQESSIPAPCRDDHHVFEGNVCVYCPFIRVGETA